uniref:Reverse transcriptase domain-containing protein n=1 Tax=Knipowitschia caucasica TaxID=637954 RepID=A0AAV2JLM6_KNICA
MERDMQRISMDSTQTTSSSSSFSSSLPNAEESDPRMYAGEQVVSAPPASGKASLSIQRQDVETARARGATLWEDLPGCVLSPLLFSLYTNHCTSSNDSVKLLKFADDTTLIGLISNNDESAYRREVDRLVSWCSGNNLELNAQKTVEMIVDFRKSTVPPPPPSVMDSPITSVESFRFLGTTITQDLKWEPIISSLIKKAQQRMYFLRQLRKAKLPAQMLVHFYKAIIESILTSSVTVWLKRLDREDFPSESALRDQLLLGLRDSPLSQALNVFARRNPELEFSDLRQEAVLLASEYGRAEPEEPNWKEQLKREIMEDVKMQMKGITQEIVAELKPLLQTASPQPSPPNPTRTRQSTPRPYNDRDAQGRFSKLGRLYHIEEADVQGPHSLSLSLEDDGVVVVTRVEQRELKALLQKWEQVFSQHEEDFGRTNIVQHQILTGDAAPIRQRYRPIPPMLYKEVKTLLSGAELDRKQETVPDSRGTQRQGGSLPCV